MSVVSLAIIGKGNEPLYLRDFLRETSMDDSALFGLSDSGVETDTPNKASSSSSSISLRQEFILHAALDRFVQVNGPPPGLAWRLAPNTVSSQNTSPQAALSENTDPQFVGLLGPWDDLQVYGWMTTTQIKFLVAVQDTNPPLSLLRQLHELYVEYRLNPLGPLTGPIQSKRFDLKVLQAVEAYNQT